MHRQLTAAITSNRNPFNPGKIGAVNHLTHEFIDDGTALKDQSTPEIHEALQAGSVEFRGAQYGSVDLTGYEYLNAEVWTIEFEFYNSVAIHSAVVPQMTTHIGTVQTYNGVLFGAFTGALLDEVITVASGVDGRSAFTSDIAFIIGAGAHTLKIQWNGTGYDIYLDDVQVNNATAGTEAVLILNRLLFGADGAASAYFLNNTNLYNITLKNQAGTVIFQNAMAYGADANIISTVGPDGTLVGGLTSDRVLSSLFGHDGYNTLGWSEGVTDGVELIPSLDFNNWNEAQGAVVTSANSFEEDSNGGGVFKLLLTVGVNYRLIIAGAASASLKITNGGITAVYGTNFGTHDFTAVNDGNLYLKLIAPGTCIVTSISLQEIPQGIIPADPALNGLDIYGNPLTYSGKAQQNLDVFGYTVDWDGVAYATLTSAIDAAGDWKIITGVNIPALISRAYFISGAGYSIRLDVGRIFKIIAGGPVVTFAGVVIVEDTYYDISFIVVGTSVTVTAVDLLGNIQTETKTMVRGAGNFQYIVSSDSLVGSFIGTMPYMQFYNASNTLTNHWVMEGRNAVGDIQTTIYDVVGDNDTTIVSGTTPLYTEAMLDVPSYLARWGGHIDAVNVVPFGATAEANTFNGPWDAPDDILTAKVSVATLKIQEADLTGFWINKTTGVANTVAVEDVALIPDYQYRNYRSNALYSESLTGKRKDQADRYFELV